MSREIGHATTGSERGQDDTGHGNTVIRAVQPTILKGCTTRSQMLNRGISVLILIHVLKWCLLI